MLPEAQLLEEEAQLRRRKGPVTDIAVSSSTPIKFRRISPPLYGARGTMRALRGSWHSAGDALVRDQHLVV